MLFWYSITKKSIITFRDSLTIILNKILQVWWKWFAPIAYLFIFQVVRTFCQPLQNGKNILSISFCIKFYHQRIYFGVSVHTLTIFLSPIFSKSLILLTHSKEAYIKHFQIPPFQKGVIHVSLFGKHTMNAVLRTDSVL